jgi:hypothetical protein
MLGTWEVRYPFSGDEPEKLRRYDPRISGQIYINDTTRKLEMRFIVTGDNIWADRDQVIDMISLRNSVQDEYSMIYYYKGKRRLTEKAASHIVPEATGSDSATVDVEVFASLDFQAKRGVPIRRMKGRWFDLNGNIVRVLLLMEQADKQSGTPPFRSKLSEVSVPDTRQFMPMGELFFEWIGPPPSGEVAQ